MEIKFSLTILYCAATLLIYESSAFTINNSSNLPFLSASSLQSLITMQNILDTLSQHKVDQVLRQSPLCSGIFFNKLMIQDETTNSISTARISRYKTVWTKSHSNYGGYGGCCRTKVEARAPKTITYMKKEYRVVQLPESYQIVVVGLCSHDSKCSSGECQEDQSYFTQLLVWDETLNSYPPLRFVPVKHSRFCKCVNFGVNTIDLLLGLNITDYQPPMLIDNFGVNTKYQPPMPSDNFGLNTDYQPPMPRVNFGINTDYQPPMPSVNFGVNTDYQPPMPSGNFGLNITDYQPPMPSDNFGVNADYQPPMPSDNFELNITDYQPPMPSDNFGVNTDYQPPMPSDNFGLNITDYQPQMPSDNFGINTDYQPPMPSDNFGVNTDYQPPMPSDNFGANTDYQPPMQMRQLLRKLTLSASKAKDTTVAKEATGY